MRKILVSITILFVVICPAVAHADLGPKPTMKFNIIFETSKQITLVGGQQYECKDKICLDIKPLEELGPQGFYCQNNSCKSMAYGYSPYQKLVLNFSDRNRESQIFSTNSFDAEFNVRVTDSQLMVEEINASKTILNNTKGDFLLFLNALIITLVLELLVALIYLLVLKISKKLLVWVLIANLISLPMVWFIFPLIRIGNLIYPIHIIILSEIFAIIFEAYFVYYLGKNQITLKRSLILSILMNFVSLFLGGYIYLILNIF